MQEFEAANMKVNVYHSELYLKKFIYVSRRFVWLSLFKDVHVQFVVFSDKTKSELHSILVYRKAFCLQMGMTEEMMNDTLDDLLTESGDEEEQDAIVNQVGCVCICISVCIFICISVCICICISVCIFIGISVCICVYEFPAIHFYESVSRNVETRLINSLLNLMNV